jgi:rhodanese-related sulfurtransferase
MPGQIFDVRELKERLAKGAQLIDVLPLEDFEEDHIPGAINIPNKELNAKTAARLSKDRPVIAYCYDYA